MTADLKASDEGRDLNDIVPLWANSAFDLWAEMSSWKEFEQASEFRTNVIISNTTDHQFGQTLKNCSFTKESKKELILLNRIFLKQTDISPAKTVLSIHEYTLTLMTHF